MHGLLFKVSTGRSCPGGSDAPGSWSSVRLEEGCGPSEDLVQEAGYMYGLRTGVVFQTAVGVGKALPSSPQSV